MGGEENRERVEEFQGFYGPYQVSEILLQKIWRDGAFDLRGLKDQWGRTVEVIYPGNWNRLDGPDFKNARLKIADVFVEGDVEVHFKQGDWTAHRHDRDPAFSNVALHVVLYPLNSLAHPTLTESGSVVPSVSLIHLLWFDLEEYATEDSILSSTGVENTPFVEELLGMPFEARVAILKERAQERWGLKRHFSERRVEQLGWEEACHMSALEVLGYGRNRVPMLLAAGRYSLEGMRRGALEIEQLWDAGEGKWRMSGVRPANHPRLRLAQYVDWVKERPHWPEALLTFSKDLQVDTGNRSIGSRYRRETKMAALRETLSDGVVDNRVAGSKLDTLLCDAFLPLLSAKTGRDYYRLWFNWYAGNAPASCLSDLRRLEVTKTGGLPMSNGWIQGILRVTG